MINFLACPYPDLAPIFSLVKYVISIFAVVIPIVLIVLGIIDFSKSVMAKDEGEIKKNQGIFIKRVIYAVAIFFVYTIVTLVMNLVSKYIDEDANSFLQCFNGEYSESSNNNNNDDSNNNNNNDDSNLNDDVEIVNYYVHYEDNDTATKARCCYSIQLKLKNGTFVNPEQVKYVFDGTETSDGCREVDSSAQCGITGKVPNEIRTLYKGIECRIYWDSINNKYVYANPFCKSVLSNNNDSNLNDDVEIVNYNVHYKDNDTATKARCCYSIQLKLKNGTFVNPEQVKYVFDGTETSDGCREVDSSAQCGITGKVPNEIRTLYKGIECRIYWDSINNKYVYANPFCKSVLSNNNNSN